MATPPDASQIWHQVAWLFVLALPAYARLRVDIKSERVDIAVKESIAKKRP